MLVRGIPLYNVNNMAPPTHTTVPNTLPLPALLLMFALSNLFTCMHLMYWEVGKQRILRPHWGRPVTTLPVTPASEILNSSKSRSPMFWPLAKFHYDWSWVHCRIDLSVKYVNSKKRKKEVESLFLHVISLVMVSTPFGFLDFFFFFGQDI